MCRFLTRDEGAPTGVKRLVVPHTEDLPGVEVLGRTQVGETAGTPEGTNARAYSCTAWNPVCPAKPPGRGGFQDAVGTSTLSPAEGALWDIAGHNPITPDAGFMTR